MAIWIVAALAVVNLAATIIFVAIRATRGVEYVDGELRQTYAAGSPDFIISEQLSMTGQNLEDMQRAGTVYYAVHRSLMLTTEYEQFVELGGSVVVSDDTTRRYLHIKASLQQFEQFADIAEETLVQETAVTEFLFFRIRSLVNDVLHAYVNSDAYRRNMVAAQQRYITLGNLLSESLSNNMPDADAMRLAHEISRLHRMLSAAGAIPAQYFTQDGRPIQIDTEPRYITAVNRIMQADTARTHQEQIWRAQYIVEDTADAIMQGGNISTSISEEAAAQQQINYEEYARVVAEQMEREQELINKQRRERLAAQAKAMAFLKEHLTPEQINDLDGHGWFFVKGGSTGRRYRIRNNSQMNVDELREVQASDGSMREAPVRVHCVVAAEKGIPLGDQLLMQKLMLETDEHKFLKTANSQDALGNGLTGMDTYIDAMQRFQEAIRTATDEIADAVGETFRFIRH